MVLIFDPLSYILCCDGRTIVGLVAGSITYDEHRRRTATSEIIPP